MAGAQGRPPGSLEREVIACLAASDGALTPAEVQAQLGGDRAYTTIMTTLARLHGKHALERSPRGRAFAYRLVGGAQGDARANVTAHQMLKLLDTGQDRGDVLTRFVADLKPEDERLLGELLARASGAGPNAEPEGPGAPEGSGRRRRGGTAP